jgi:hypothetical protein
VDSLPLKKTPLTLSCNLPLLESRSPSCLMWCWSFISHFDLFDFLINILFDLYKIKNSEHQELHIDITMFCYRKSWIYIRTVKGLKDKNKRFLWGGGYLREGQCSLY